MKKQSKITNLVVVPLIAYAIFLASPAIAATNTNNLPQSEIKHKTSTENTFDPENGIVGIVTAVNDEIITIATKDNIRYTVDAGHATIMKESETSNSNPYLVTATEIQVGDTIIVRGIISDVEV